MNTTNYYNTFIEVAEDCPVQAAEAPSQSGPALSTAAIQFELVAESPYIYTSDDVIFRVHQLKHDVSDQSALAERERFFANGQPCMRSSALGKRYGWGVHSNPEGRLALYARESERYAQLASDPEIVHLKALRSKRA
jgi:Family of unknown function (DUF6157)